MFTRVWLGLGALVLALGLWLPTGVLAGTCDYRCQAMNGSAVVGEARSAPQVTVADEAACRTSCTSFCNTALTPAVRRERGITSVVCVSGSVVYSARATAPAAAPAAAADGLRCEQYICTLGEGYSNETLTSLPSIVGGVPASYTCSAALDVSQACLRSCEYACSFYRRGEPGITTPYRCAPTYRPRCFGTAPAAATTDPSTVKTAAPAADPGISGRLGLPPCAVSHDPSIAGKCTLNDIKAVAVNFANFLMGLAAAFFLAIFVWAGFKYIFFAYDSGVAADARKTLVSAAIGMLLVLGAATIVRFVSSAATGGSSSSSSSNKAGTTSAPAP
ncbi:hypothetical protein KBD61_02625 [Patescibacteria group bacterium]|nr:hypothetical protein [Patescibacteria group bacterium]MBP9709899.1 hypothetical protein [Patescibacteria group bacterium]